MDPSKLPLPQETKLHFLDYWRIIRIRKTVILAVFLLVVITATLVTFILPESFSSTARIKVERDGSDITGFTDRGLMSNYDPYFIQTEFEFIQSEIILGKVAEALDLQREWGKKYASGERLKTDEAIRLLKARMDLRPVRNTSFIEIRVFSEKADEAAILANAIAEAYRDHRKEERRRLSTGGINALEERWDEHDQKIKDAQGEVERLREELKIPDAVAMFAAPMQPLSNEEVRRLDAMRIQYQAELVSEQELLKELKSRSREDLKNALPTAVPDPQLSSLLEQLNTAEQRLILQRKDYGPENLGLLNTQELVDDINRKIDERISGILVGLEVRVARMKAYVDYLTEQVEKAKTVDIEFSKKSRPYFDAKERVENLKRFQLALTTKIAAERIDVELPKTTMVEIVDTAKPGIRPVRPNKMLNIILGVVIGLVVGVGLAFFIEYLDTSVKTIDDVERTLQSPVLGVIPQNVGLLIDEGAESPHAEAYRVLRTNLLFSRKDDKLNSVAVVSAGAGEGKSTTVFNMASVFAQSGQRVLIVDSDLRRPTLHKMLRVSNSLGLTNYLLKQNTLEEVVQTTKLPMLDFMASGKLPSSSLGILSSAQMKNLINELKQRYDFVFFDSPPIMGVSDASILASEVDMTLQVIQYRRYPQPMNIRAKQMIEKVGGNLVGIVLNNINMSQDESYYYYSGYYHDYYSKNEDEPESAARGEGATVAKAKLDIKQKY
jgi:polysaccharide biosynthesis transport protein